MTTKAGGQLEPVKFCLRFRPPTIAIVYQVKQKKYVHEFPVEIREGADLGKLCDQLIEREKHYFNKIKKEQVLELMQKLHAHLHPAGVNKENQQQRKPNFLEKKRFVDYGEPPEPAKEPAKLAVGNTVLGTSNKQQDEDEDDYENDPWDMDAKESPDKKKKSAFDDDFDDLDFGKDAKKGLVGSAKPAEPVKKPEDKKRAEIDNGLLVDDDFGDDFGEDEEEEEPTEKPKESAKPDATKQNEAAKEAMAGIAGGDEADQEKLILEQFQVIYDRDAQLREIIGTESSSLTLEEKYQILTAYLNGGGVQGLIQSEEVDSEEAQAIEEEFKAIFESDAKLREILGGEAALSQLNLKDKYQVLVAYKKGGGVQGLLGEGDADGADESSVIEHEGQKFKRVQIEGENQEFLMDEAGNIYDLEFNYVGQANGSDEEN